MDPTCLFSFYRLTCNLLNTHTFKETLPTFLSYTNRELYCCSPGTSQIILTYPKNLQLLSLVILKAILRHPDDLLICLDTVH